MSSFDAAPSHSLRNFLTILVLLLLVVVVIAFVRGGAPVVETPGFPAAVGIHRDATFQFKQSMGIRSVKIFYEQNGKVWPVLEKNYGGRNWLFSGSQPRDLTLTAQIGRRDVPGLLDGPAVLVLRATGANLRGSTTTLRKPVTVESIPPQLAVLTSQHYVVQGGVEMVVYQVSKNATRSGVEMAGHFFPGYQLRHARPGVMFALYAMAYNAPASAEPVLIAEDAAGNRTVANIPGKTFPQTYKPRKIPISDAFISHVVMAIIANMPSLTPHRDPLKNFLMVNHDLRRVEAHQLSEISKVSEHRFLWRGRFLQLPNAKVEAHFADHRLYVYHGQVVDDEYHLGYDLASVEHAPIPAANSGRVVWAKYFGIYGNCVLIDHGYGLMSLYGHMNDFMVKAGEMVKKGQIIGHTDTTGLAAGDHLHFSTLLDGVQVDPMEWWDPHWIQVHITVKLQQFDPVLAEEMSRPLPE